MAQSLDAQGCSHHQPQDPFVTGLGPCLVVMVLGGLDRFMDMVLYHHLLHPSFIPFQRHYLRTVVVFLVIDSSSASCPLYNGKQDHALHIEGLAGSILAAWLYPWPISP